MSSYKPADSKREEFRKYLDRSGVNDALAKVLVKLYQEENRPKSEQVLSYVVKELAAIKAEEYNSSEYNAR